MNLRLKNVIFGLTQFYKFETYFICVIWLIWPAYVSLCAFARAAAIILKEILNFSWNEILEYILICHSIFCNSLTIWMKLYLPNSHQRPQIYSQKWFSMKWILFKSLHLFQHIVYFRICLKIEMKYYLYFWCFDMHVALCSCHCSHNSIYK